MLHLLATIAGLVNASEQDGSSCDVSVVDSTSRIQQSSTEILESTFTVADRGNDANTGIQDQY